jgi:hypothetical protein
VQHASSITTRSYWPSRRTRMRTARGGSSAVRAAAARCRGWGILRVQVWVRVAGCGWRARARAKGRERAGAGARMERALFPFRSCSSDLLWMTRPLSRTLDHPSPPLPRDPSWTFGCWPPCRPFHAYAPKPKFVFLRYVPVLYARFWLTKHIPSNPVHPTPPFPSVPGWTFRRWPPPCQIDQERVTAILFFFEVYSCVRAPSFY